MAVKASDLTLNDLLEMNSKDGNTLQAKRMFISSADAWGALFKDLIKAIGIERAKRFLFRYGYQCGKHEALMLRDIFEWANQEEWILAGVTMHNITGRASSRPINNKINTKTGEFDVHGYWYNSYEAKQYLQHFPVHSESVCNFLQGYASGYCSTSLGKRVIFKEVECMGKGDMHCRYVGKTLDLWGEDIPWYLLDFAQDDIGNELDQAYKRIEKQSEILDRINTLNNQLTQTVLQGKGLYEIAQTLGKSLDCGVVISNQYFEPIAEYGQIFNYSLKKIINNIRELRLPEQKQVEKMLNERATINLNNLQDIGYPFFSMITPIVARNNKFGYISIISNSQKFKGHESPFIERTANICALHILNEKTIAETEHRMKEELLDEILHKPNLHSTVVKRLSYLGYNLNEPHYVFIFRLKSNSNNESLSDEKEQIVNILRSHSLNTDQKLLVSNQFGQVCALIPESLIQSHGVSLTKYGEAIIKTVKQNIPNSQVVIGISNLCKGIHSFHQGYKEALKALDFSHIKNHKEKVVLFSKLGYISILLDARNPEELDAYAQKILGPILEHDLQKSTELVKTLYFYLDNECNLHKTARYMNLSIGGMRYRLSNIKERFHIDMMNSDTRREVQLALDIYLAFGKLPNNNTTKE